MRLPHWQHFLSLEKDFIETVEYVELSENNNSTYSIAYTKLYLAICSEIDVVAKLVCKKVNLTSSAKNMNDYRAELKDAYPNFHTVECMVPRYDLTIKPWSDWSGDRNPQWWTDYNKVKHNRSTQANKANQKNVKNALCGLFTILLYLYQKELYSGDIYPNPAFLEYDKMSGNLVVNLGAELPDIPR
ncbi:hypothetical protein AB4564_19030 [Vibrio sp. 10N.222.51.E8]|uniref:hypothetical protein n=1 Tax=Vibrio TaxID=662 RepID=UPI001053B4DF|nr:MULTISPECIES: hypothetical protein [Vibrio]TCN98898.1 hypothetical protein EDB50_101681 [Vibrio crassostreae]TKG32343.1 hypothetical protein FCV85_10660 [Vibrio sp. F13]